MLLQIRFFFPLLINKKGIYDPCYRLPRTNPQYCFLKPGAIRPQVVPGCTQGVGSAGHSLVWVLCSWREGTREAAAVSNARSQTGQNNLIED